MRLRILCGEPGMERGEPAHARRAVIRVDEVSGSDDTVAAGNGTWDAAVAEKSRSEIVPGEGSSTPGLLLLRDQAVESGAYSVIPAREGVVEGASRA